MTRPATGHPSPQTLNAFGLGQLAADEWATVEAHVAECAECCRTLQNVDDDTMVELAREARQSGFTSPGESLRIPPELVDHPRYRVLGPIGSGGMGVVFKAEHRLMERPVALKVIHRDLVANADAVQRFRREVTTAARLNHPNIVQAYDAEQAGGIHFLAMEYVDGVNLARDVAERGRLPVREACGLIVQAAAGLNHAHALGMIHRDIKPHNLMRTPEGRLKILDFGLARLARQATLERPTSGTSMTAADAVVGTPDYLAPEQARSARDVDIRADIYGLGCTLYFLLTGRPPFAGGSALDKMIQHCTEAPAPITAQRRDVPDSLVCVIERMLAKNPDDRFQTPNDVIDALRPFAPPDAEPKAPQAPPRNLWRKVMVAIVAGAVFALAISGWNAWQQQAKPLPRPTRVLIVIPQEQLHLNDYVPIRRALEDAGIPVDTASSGPNPCQLDKYSKGEPVRPDRVLDGSITIDPYDAVVFVGGGAQEFYGNDAASANAGRLIRDALNRPDRRVAAVCVGQAIPLKHGALNGRRIAQSQYLSPWLEDHGEPSPPRGAIVVPEPLVIDGRLITAGDPEHSPLLGDELVRILTRKNP